MVVRELRIIKKIGRVEKMRGVNTLGRRGVSEIISVLLITGMIAGLSSFFLVYGAQRAERETWGILDLVRANERRMNQLLSLVYYAENRTTDRFNVYLFNYGTEDTIIEHIYIDETLVDPIEFRDAVTGEPTENSVPPHALVRVVLDSPAEDTFHVTLVTKWRAVYSWLLTI